ncbi:hypothetical protein DPMN_114984 [Dreissena polymorpha]|uniref:C-type lectin domain-containing protein n=1 Tax=Dreissena polymorpha TaxID=45954 RepID=A0A9D4KL88_DREPO|nr:hypothetical protein DPMN_114984 [Dreissena polymorpha]
MQVYPWIGLRKNDVNQFYWENNDDVTYTNFGYGEPNGDQRERCVQVVLYCTACDKTSLTLY